MFEKFFEHDTEGALKGLTLEWKCPQCEGLNFRILVSGQRASGECHTRCRYCRARFRVVYSEIEYMKRDDAAPGAIAEKEKALEEKVAVAKRMRR
jgi:hypothetical protein